MKIYYVKSYILLLTDLMHKHTFAWDLGVIVYQITVAVTPQSASQVLFSWAQLALLAASYC